MHKKDAPNTLVLNAGRPEVALSRKQEQQKRWCRNRHPTVLPELNYCHRQLENEHSPHRSIRHAGREDMQLSTKRLENDDLLIKSIAKQPPAASADFPLLADLLHVLQLEIEQMLLALNDHRRPEESGTNEILYNVPRDPAGDPCAVSEKGYHADKAKEEEGADAHVMPRPTHPVANSHTLFCLGVIGWLRGVQQNVLPLIHRKSPGTERPVASRHFNP